MRKDYTDFSFFIKVDTPSETSILWALVISKQTSKLMCTVDNTTMHFKIMGLRGSLISYDLVLFTPNFDLIE